MSVFLFWACPAEKGGSGYPFQVLALPSSGYGLSTSIPHANRKTRTFCQTERSRSFHPILSFRPKREIARGIRQRLAILIASRSSTIIRRVCHFEEREIFTRSSTKIGDFRYGATCEDFSFLEMTNWTKKFL